MSTDSTDDLHFNQDFTLPASNRTAMVLLVDDQMMTAEAVRRALADEPAIDFHYCSDANQALYTAAHVRPTVILQDLVMPSIGGLSLVQKYRANPATKDIPIIVLSSKEEPTVKSQAFAAGANDYLVKLPDKIELVARIKYHCRSYLNQIQRDEAYAALRESQRQLLKSNLELERVSRIDGLTGLCNRRYFDEYVEIEWRRAMRMEDPLSLLLIDIDSFKLYNDRYGHVAGDEVLRQVAKALQSSIHRPADFAARYGGEEFALLLPSTPPAGANHIGNVACNKVGELCLPHESSPISLHVTISVGVATALPERGQSTALHLIECADAALYQAKSDGKNRVVSSDQVIVC